VVPFNEVFFIPRALVREVFSMLTRRSLVQAGLAGLAATPLLRRGADPAAAPAGRPFRIAHLTDIK